MKQQETIIELLRENNDLLRKLISTQCYEKKQPELTNLKGVIEGKDLLLYMNRTNKTIKRES